MSRDIEIWPGASTEAAAGVIDGHRIIAIRMVDNESNAVCVANFTVSAFNDFADSIARLRASAKQAEFWNKL